MVAVDELRFVEGTADDGCLEGLTVLAYIDMAKGGGCTPAVAQAGEGAALGQATVELWGKRIQRVTAWVVIAALVVVGLLSAYELELARVFDIDASASIRKTRRTELFRRPILFLYGEFYYKAAKALSVVLVHPLFLDSSERVRETAALHLSLIAVNMSVFIGFLVAFSRCILKERRTVVVVLLLLLVLLPPEARRYFFRAHPEFTMVGLVGLGLVTSVVGAVSPNTGRRRLALWAVAGTAFGAALQTKVPASMPLAIVFVTLVVWQGPSAVLLFLSTLATTYVFFAYPAITKYTSKVTAAVANDGAWFAQNTNTFSFDYAVTIVGQSIGQTLPVFLAVTLLALAGPRRVTSGTLNFRLWVCALGCWSAPVYIFATRPLWVNTEHYTLVTICGACLTGALAGPALADRLRAMAPAKRIRDLVLTAGVLLLAGIFCVSEDWMGRFSQHRACRAEIPRLHTALGAVPATAVQVRTAYTPDLEGFRRSIDIRKKGRSVPFFETVKSAESTAMVGGIYLDRFAQGSAYRERITRRRRPLTDLAVYTELRRHFEGGDATFQLQARTWKRVAEGPACRVRAYSVRPTQTSAPSLPLRR